MSMPIRRPSATGSVSHRNSRRPASPRTETATFGLTRSRLGAPSSANRDLEEVVAPGRHVQVEPAPRELVAGAIVHRGRAHQVAQLERPPRQVPEGQPHVALSLRRAVVDGAKQPAAAAVPGKRDEALPSEIAVPRGPRIEKSPVAVSNLWSPQACEEATVIRAQDLIDGLGRPAAEVVGDAQFPPGALPLVDEAKARHEEGEHAGGLVDVRRKRSSRARLVVILQEARG